jgi:MoaE-MoaD fusion protein
VIRVRVRLFAIQRELAGTRELTVELADDATIDEAWAAVVARHPALGPGRPYLRFARNAAYAPPETRLADDDEVAMIPPVSGGAEAGATRIVELREAAFDPGIVAELTARLAIPADGAVVAFLGITRVTPGTPAPGQEAEASRHAGAAVTGLEYEAHPEMALRVIESIADEVESRFGVTRLAIVHRTGAVPVGEASVAIVACAPHRDAAFDAARYAIDETKARAPIWKAERFGDGHVWIGAPARESAGGRARESAGAPARPSAEPAEGDR